MTRPTYAPSFYVSISDWARSSAATIVPMLLEWGIVNSVLDVGCGSGAWLAEFSAQGINDLRGIDQGRVPDEQLLVPPAVVEARDLARGFSLRRRFDLVVCLEVAEHLPASAATTFVRSLAEHSDLVLFSAAIPNQGGHGHLNEQWPTYWASQFRDEGMTALDLLRPRLWSDPTVAAFYRQNLLVFARGASLVALGSTGETPIRDLVHPEIWSAHALPGNAVRAGGRALVPAVRSRVARVLRKR